MRTKLDKLLDECKTEEEVFELIDNNPEIIAEDLLERGHRIIYSVDDLPKNQFVMEYPDGKKIIVTNGPNETIVELGDYHERKQ
ncbi:hypothetical protein [Bartonella sp. DGB1]|uniref:hypothetical protein n=1 Tax=Bartonella sp. DGB1 TaxID=3239807 RepID=UPI0035238207